MAITFIGIILICFLITSIALWRREFKALKINQPHLLSPRDSFTPPLGFTDVLATIVIFSGTHAFAMTAITVLTGVREMDLSNVQQMTWGNFVLGTAQLLSAGLAMLFLWLRYRDPRALGVSPKTLFADITLGGFGFFLFVPPMLMLQSVLTVFWEYEHPTLEMITADSSLLTILSAWWVATIVAPVTEEILFRVILLGWLMRCFATPHDFLGGLSGGNGPRSNDSTEGTPNAGLDNTPNACADLNAHNYTRDNWASSQLPRPVADSYRHRRTWPPVIIVALLFALVHIGQGPAPIPIFFLGAGLCFMYRQTGSVVPCIVTHFLLNTFSMSILTIQQFWFPAP